jgi:hypothetical protein
MELRFRNLKAEEIECRVNQIQGNWCSLLLYKDARCDMNILDETIGDLNWKRDHKELKGNIYCGVSIYDENKKEWITKWDAGAETYTEKEKGEASDSFKRACVNFGIGRELYTSPSIFILPRKDMVKKGKEQEFYKNDKDKYETKTRFSVEYIDYDKNNAIKDLIIRDDKGHIRFSQLTKETSNKFQKIHQDMKKLIEKVESVDETFERENLYKNYGVESDADMTIAQMTEATEILKKKLGGK